MPQNRDYGLFLYHQPDHYPDPHPILRENSVRCRESAFLRFGIPVPSGSYSGRFVFRSCVLGIQSAVLGAVIANDEP